MQILIFAYARIIKWHVNERNQLKKHHKNN
jgi:hypothetical protein